MADPSPTTTEASDKHTHVASPSPDGDTTLSTKESGGATSGNTEGSSTALASGSQEKLTRRNGALGDDGVNEKTSTEPTANHISVADPRSTSPQRRETNQSSRSKKLSRSGTAAGGGALFGKKATWASLLVPEKPLKEGQISYAQSFRRIVTCTWLNVLLIFVPVCWALHFAKVADAAVFVTSMLCVASLGIVI